MNMRAFSSTFPARSLSSRTCSHVFRAPPSRSATVQARPPSAAVVSARGKSFSSSTPRPRPAHQPQEPKSFTRYTLPAQIRIDRASDMTVDKRPRKAYIALGSNLGDRIAEIERACREMDARGITVTRTSSLWETEPMYVTDQDRFVNGACEVGQPVPACHPIYVANRLTRNRSRPPWSLLTSWTSSRTSRTPWAARR